MTSEPAQPATNNKDKTMDSNNMTSKDAIEKATIMGYTGLVYHAETDCLSAMVWFCGKQTRMAIYSRGTWLLD